jgi:hypothetical protein
VLIHARLHNTRAWSSSTGRLRLPPARCRDDGAKLAASISSPSAAACCFGRRACSSLRRFTALRLSGLPCMASTACALCLRREQGPSDGHVSAFHKLLSSLPRAMGKNTGNAQKKGGDKGPADGADGVRVRVHQHGASCSAAHGFGSWFEQPSCVATCAYPPALGLTNCATHCSWDLSA